MSTLTLELPAGLDPDQVRILLAITLFKEGLVSLGYAAEIAGKSRRAFMEALGQRGVPVFNYEVEEFEDELQMIERRASSDAADPAG